MIDPSYVPSSIVSMKSRGINERALQDLISADPSLLGLGDLDVKDYERIQPSGGRLDLLLHDPESQTRFEVEVQLGATDPSHIIRCIEYWDEERRRFPQYNHVAVLVAEEVTSRFFNVISLFNRAIPMVAVQAQLITVGDAVTLTFTKVLDLATLGTDEEDTELAVETDRNYWLSKAGDESMVLVDDLFKMVAETDVDVVPSYNKHYIGQHRHGRADNYIIYKPRKAGHVLMEIVIDGDPELTDWVEDQGFDQLGYNNRYGQYRLRINRHDITERGDEIRLLVQRAQSKR
ncbi:hypothetical protein N8342_07585 [Acidimicrobiales bacterium]|nr:hypothetical protein [Acidimicrobiales bacterium]